jgi:SNF2 family DNA or RNA helicase
MGLGKTPITLAYLSATEKRAIVVCPKVVRRNWINEAMKFFSAYYTDAVIELRPVDLRKNGIMPDLRDIKLASVNYESFEKFLPAIQAAGFDTIVIDESHRFRNPKAKITKTLKSVRHLFSHKILLSGTAIKNKKIELHTQTEFIQPGLFTKNELNLGTIGGVWNKLRKSIYLSMTKKDVLKDLPDKITQIIELEVEGMPELPTDIGDMSWTKVEAALCKYEATCDFITEILDSSDSCCLVYSESVETAKLIAETFGELAILHHGQMSDNAREKAKSDFQEGKTKARILVSTRQSLSEGVNLTRADKVIFNDLPWTAADILQSENRTHRIGQKNCVNVYWITAAGSDWDCNLTDIIRRKYSLCKRITEGKQVTKEEQDWLNKPIRLEDLK